METPSPEIVTFKKALDREKTKYKIKVFSEDIIQITFIASLKWVSRHRMILSSLTWHWYARHILNEGRFKMGLFIKKEDLLNKMAEILEILSTV